MKKTLLFVAMMVAVFALVAQPKHTPSSVKANLPMHNPDPKSQMFDDVELYPSFAIDPTSKYWTWANYTVGNTYSFVGTTFPNQGLTMSYMAFNAEQSTPAMPTMAGHSGDKTFSSFANVSVNPSNKWLMTKELIPDGGTMTFSFWAKTYTDQYGAERFKVRTSTATNAQADFTNYLAGSASTYVNVPTAWTEYSYTIPTGTKFVGIQCVSDDAFVFMLDDLKFVGATVEGAEDPDPGCLAASNMRVNPKANGFELKWDSPENNVEILTQAGNPGPYVYGLTGSDFGFYHRFAAEDLAAVIGKSISRFGFEPVYSSQVEAPEHTYKVQIYKGGNWHASEPTERFAGQLVQEIPFTKEKLNWNTFMRLEINPILITGTEEIWMGANVYVDEDGSAHAGFGDDLIGTPNEGKGNLMYFEEDDEWLTAWEATDSWDFNWFLRAYIITENHVPVNIYRSNVKIVSDFMGQTYFDETNSAANTCYYVKVHCPDQTESEKTLTVCSRFTSVNENRNTPFTIYPNPANSTLNVKADGAFHTVEVINFLGQVVISQPKANETTSISVANLTNGVYFVRLISNEGTTVQKFVKN